jgi:hypothetical protein
MISKKCSEDYSEQATEQRLDAMLRGAFSGPPTPLKNIPKKSGESRAAKARESSDANAGTVPPRT